MATKLNLAMVLTRDMPRTKAFYTDLLGFEVVKEFSSPDDSFVFLRSSAGGPSIALQDASKETYGAPQDLGGVIAGFVVDDTDAAYREWKSKSVEVVGEVIDIGAGRMFTAKDPAGNYIQVYHLYPQVHDMQKQMGLI
jgi:predicted enzyme related to lactoylglutathione lyase